MFTRYAAAAVLTLSCAFPALAGGPSPQDAEALVQRVADYYAEHGLDATVAAVGDKNDEMFHGFDGELYAFIGNREGVFLAHGANPALANKDLMELRDPNGVPLVQGLIRVGLDEGGGWLDYVWNNPSTNKLQDKTTYVAPLEDGVYVGSGVYK